MGRRCGAAAPGESRSAGRDAAASCREARAWKPYRRSDRRRRLPRDVRDNIVSRVDADAYRAAVSGAGREGRKIRAPWSSAALALNTFGPWHRDPSTLLLATASGFETLEFERACHSGLRGTPPHLDVLACGSRDIVGVESKCTEILSPKKARFSVAYDRIADRRRASPWFQQIALSRESSSAYRFLDIAQLVKHYLGVTHTFESREITLLYLFWEPSDWKEYEPYRRHRHELDRFCEQVEGDPFVTFRATSYATLWSGWRSRRGQPWLREHLQELDDRYRLRLGPFLEV